MMAPVSIKCRYIGQEYDILKIVQHGKNILGNEGLYILINYYPYQ